MPDLRLPLLALCTSLGLVACGDPAVTATGDSGAKQIETSSEAVAASEPSRVVVAVIDTGINPYHAFYNAGSAIYPAGSPPSSVTPALLAELGIDAAHQLTLTRTGDFAADFAADAAIWAGIQKGELYWFKGTNIIATTAKDPSTGGIPIMPDSESDTHGVGTSSAVLAANPEAVLLFVEFDSIGSEASHALALLNPAVDIVSTSYGYAVPLAGVPLPLPMHYPYTYQAVVEQGKLFFAAAGNGPGVTPLGNGTAGPWWVIGISGFEEGSSNGRTLLSSLFPDFIADYTQDLPYCAACESGTNAFTAGTSFSTPLSAGVASRILLEARRALGHQGGIVVPAADAPQLAVAADGRTLSNWQLRRSMEAAAYIPQLADYDPVAGITDAVGLPIIPVLSWLQIGWGVLSADPEKQVVSRALGYLGLGGVAPEAKDAGYCSSQTANVQFRHQYWDVVAPLFDPSIVPVSGDPFIYC